MTKVFFALLAWSVSSWACEPVAGFKAPTLEENYKISRIVVSGTIEKKGPASEGYSYEFKVQKAWKGTLLKNLTVTSGTGSTCDGFPQTAEVGASCVLFLGPKNDIFSGIQNGSASICVPAGSERVKSLQQEYDTRFKSFPR